MLPYARDHLHTPLPIYTTNTHEGGWGARPQAGQDGGQRCLPGGDDAAARRAQLRVPRRILFKRL